MASSNRHWPSMFKSKPCNPHHQWQHDINSSLMSTGCIRTPYNTSGGGCEERSPEPKPRWNPKPEQIRILEAIFNSGMVNPPRDEIRKIRAQLQEYGQVGDANVFYWFQNRKSRSKHKLRHLQNSKNNNNNQNINDPVHEQPPPPPQNPASLPLITALPSSSSSSSSEKSSPKELIPNNTKVFSLGFTDLVPNSPTASVNQNYFQTHHHHNDSTSTRLLPPPPHTETFFFPVQLQHGQGGLPVVPNNTGVNVMTSQQQSQGFCFSELSNVVHAQSSPLHGHAGHCTSGTLLLGEIMSQGGCSKKDQHQDQDQDKSLKTMHQQLPQLNFCVTPTTTVVVPPATSTTITVPSPIIPQLHQGIADPGVAARSTVFINDVAFEVGAGPFNVREAFGEDAVLINATGQPVLTNQWGVTLQSLQHGACYYLI